MRIFLKVTSESIRQAFQQLTGNRLRSFLSLLGISIGIFCIIGVLSAVDSLEDNIRGSMEKLGNDIIYVQKWPWEDNSNNWWEIFRNPHPNYREYELVKERSHSAALTTFFMEGGPKVLKWQDNVVERAFLCGVTLEFTQLFGLDFDRGRFFSSAEDRYNANKVVLGYNVAQALFADIDPIGREVKLQGGRYEVVGVLADSGDALINPLDFDEAIIITYNKLRSFVNVRNERRETFIAIKARPNTDLEQLKGEVKTLVRAERRLKPREDDTFSFNELDMVSRSFDSFFGVLNLLGWVIGGFSILVGGVSVANIMFVSVKERTGLIGVKMALGAKKYIILLEFLIEAIILCLLGGLIGMVLISIVAKLITNALDFPIYLDMGNVFLGTSLSVFIGVVAGFIPALQASRLDPVEAMRH